MSNAVMTWRGLRKAARSLLVVLRSPVVTSAIAVCAPSLGALIASEYLSDAGYALPGKLVFLASILAAVGLGCARSLRWHRGLVAARLVQFGLVGLAFGACVMVQPGALTTAALVCGMLAIFEAAMRTPDDVALKWSGGLYLVPLTVAAVLIGQIQVASCLVIVWVAVATLQRLRLQAESNARRLQLQIREANSLVEIVERQNSQMIMEAGHDLRQPVHALGMMLDQLTPDASRHDLQVRIEEIRSTVDMVSEMLADILDLSRLRRGEYLVEMQPVNLPAICAEVERAFAPIAARKGVVLIVKSARVWVMSDPGLLRRIIQNLVTNAVKYTNQGNIALTASARGDAVLLRVRDTGRGIPQSKIDAIFSDFVRLDPRGPEAGLGIGLGVVRRATQLLQHPLQVKSKFGSGSEFSIELPLAPMDSDMDMFSRDVSPSVCGDKTVFLVENDPVLRNSTRDVIRSTGAHVLCFEGAEAALEAFAQTTAPDVLVTDYHLEGLDGLELIDRLQHIHPGLSIPSVLLTGDLNPQVQKLARSRGIRVAHKPVRPQRLKDILGSALSGQPLSEPMQLNNV